MAGKLQIYADEELGIAAKERKERKNKPRIDPPSQSLRRDRPQMNQPSREAMAASCNHRL
jgi:hypothetical protein